jgi:hypothetical protein
MFRTRHRVLIALVAAISGAAIPAAGQADSGDARGCRSVPSVGSTAVPNVVGTQFDRALGDVLDRQLLVSVRHFIPFTNAPAEQGWGRLENYRVVAQSPPPGRSLRAGRAVSVILDRPRFTGPLGSMVVPTTHPTYAEVPDLVGLDYQQAMAAGDGFSTGIFVRVGRTGPLSAAASACDLNAFVVSAQTPRPGTRVLWAGVKPHGVAPGIATVTITLVSRAPKPTR